jgi:hypothetical protein
VYVQSSAFFFTDRQVIAPTNKKTEKGQNRFVISSQVTSKHKNAGREQFPAGKR